MKKEEVLRRVTEGGLVAVVRAASGEEAKRITDACIAGGVVGIEITFTVPGAHHVLEELAKVYGNGEVGVGRGQRSGSGNGSHRYSQRRPVRGNAESKCGNCTVVQPLSRAGYAWRVYLEGCCKRFGTGRRYYQGLSGRTFWTQDYQSFPRAGAAGSTDAYGWCVSGERWRMDSSRSGCGWCRRQLDWRRKNRRLCRHYGDS